MISLWILDFKYVEKMWNEFGSKDCQKNKTSLKSKSAAKSTRWSICALFFAITSVIGAKCSNETDLIFYEPDHTIYIYILSFLLFFRIRSMSEIRWSRNWFSNDDKYRFIHTLNIESISWSFFLLLSFPINKQNMSFRFFVIWIDLKWAAKMHLKHFKLNKTNRKLKKKCL